MKKIALLLLAGLSFSFAQAQSARVGLKGGVNYSNLAGDLENEDVYQNKIGFNGGLTFNFPLVGDNFLSIQPEVLYSQKGYRYRDEEYLSLNPLVYPGQQVRTTGDMNFNYLDVPVLLKVNAGGLFFEGGPQASYLLAIRDNTKTTRVSDGKELESGERINKDNLAELEVGYAVGLGFQAASGVSLGLRYNGSINKLAKNNEDELTNARHSLFQLQLGFSLGGNSTPAAQ